MSRQLISLDVRDIMNKIKILLVRVAGCQDEDRHVGVILHLTTLTLMIDNGLANKDQITRRLIATQRSLPDDYVSERVTRQLERIVSYLDRYDPRSYNLGQPEGGSHELCDPPTVVF